MLASAAWGEKGREEEEGAEEDEQECEKGEEIRHRMS